MRSFTTQALVLKRSNVGETDRVVTLLTKDRGKIMVVAKGVRKMASTKRASLEPGNLIRAFCVETKSWPLLTQTHLVEDCFTARADLKLIRRLTQFLEMCERLFVEEELDVGLFELLVDVRAELLAGKPYSALRNQIEILITTLGYEPLAQTKYGSLSDYVGALSDKPMRGFEYLTV